MVGSWEPRVTWIQGLLPFSLNITSAPMTERVRLMRTVAAQSVVLLISTPKPAKPPETAFRSVPVAVPETRPENSRSVKFPLRQVADWAASRIPEVGPGVRVWSSRPRILDMPY